MADFCTFKIIRHFFFWTKETLENPTCLSIFCSIKCALVQDFFSRKATLIIFLSCHLLLMFHNLLLLICRLWDAAAKQLCQRNGHEILLWFQVELKRFSLRWRKFQDVLHGHWKTNAIHIHEASITIMNMFGRYLETKFKDDCIFNNCLCYSNVPCNYLNLFK